MKPEHKGGDWTDQEIIRFTSRQSKLISLGLPDVEAESLSQTLLYRDRPNSGDDRIVCLECANWARKCTKEKPGYCSVPTVMQRCDGFTSRVAV